MHVCSYVWVWKEFSYSEIKNERLELSTFYRTGLNKGKDITTLGNELMNIQAYIKIQLFSYSESIDVVYNIVTSLSDAPFPNFILQPLVENALDLYWDNYMLTIDIEPDRGTTAFFRIPCDMGQEK